MRVGRQRREGADGAGDLEKDVGSAEVVRSDGGTPRGQVGPASEAEVERLEPLRSFEEQRRRLVAVARHGGSVTTQERGSRLLEAVERAALRRRPGAAAPPRTLRPGSSPPPRPARARPGGSGPGSARSLARGSAAAAARPPRSLRASCGAFQVGGHGFVRLGGGERAVPRAAVGGELGIARPPPARRGRAVVRRVTRLGTPPSAPAGGGIEHGRRSPAVRLRSREPARPARWRAGRPPATAARRPRAAPLPPAGSVAASPRAIRRRAAGTAPPADL